jgi:hypothetical protein
VEHLQKIEEEQKQVALAASMQDTKNRISIAFNPYKANAEKFAEECKHIEIVDETTLAMADQKLSKAHDVKKQVEALHKERKAPFHEIGKFIDEQKNAIVSMIDDAINYGKQKKLEYAKVLEEKKKEELARIAAEEHRIFTLKNKIISYENEAINAINQCNDQESLTACSQKYLGGFPEDSTWQEFVQEAKDMALRILEVGKARRAFITEQEILKASQDEASKQLAEANRIKAEQDAQRQQLELRERAIAEAQEAERIRLENEAKAKEVEAQKVKGTTSTMKFEVNDFSKVPDEFKALDEVKVRAWLKENKHAIKSGDIHHGLKFYLDSGIRVS